MLTFTCEACGKQPEQITIIEIAADTPLFFAACPACWNEVAALPESDPLRIAVINRMITFKSEWPLKAEMNLLGHISKKAEHNPDLAIQMLQAWRQESVVLKQKAKAASG